MKRDKEATELRTKQEREMLEKKLLDQKKNEAEREAERVAFNDQKVREEAERVRKEQESILRL